MWVETRVSTIVTATVKLGDRSEDSLFHCFPFSISPSLFLNVQLSSDNNLTLFFVFEVVILLFNSVPL